MSDDADTLVEIRDVVHAIHDARVGLKHGKGLSEMEMAALRDCHRRLTDVIGRLNGSAAAVEQEREACAKVADEEARRAYEWLRTTGNREVECAQGGGAAAAEAIAVAIRARKGSG